MIMTNHVHMIISRNSKNALEDIMRDMGVHENPVRAGFVEKAEDWVYSSAGDYYANRKGLIELSYV